ncbi:hypothetical protein PVAP13_9KG624100 [Panicum virgatum]|uniref:Uncharacterized protein n=1 Tax=Panicum virgatum TaxID=38727 RepID=A0A8T0NWQ6_PANVG|nr:hypothetical protein PVAP13_9KG624100 [Panicum virgatum]
MLLPPLLRVGPSAPCLGFALRPRQRPRLPPGRQVGLLRTGARSLRRTSTPPVRDHTHTQSICTEGGPQVPRINGTAAAHLAAVASESRAFKRNVLHVMCLMNCAQEASTIVFTAVGHIQVI